MPIVLLLIFCVFFCGCATTKITDYELNVVPDSVEMTTTYEADTNGLSNWDGQKCTPCDTAWTNGGAIPAIYNCVFNLGLKETVSKTGARTYEMRLVHYQPFKVADGYSLIINVDGQLLQFARNANTSGIYYDLTLDQLQQIINGKQVLVKIVAVNGYVELAFTAPNQAFFKELLEDPTVLGSAPVVSH